MDYKGQDGEMGRRVSDKAEAYGKGKMEMMEDTCRGKRRGGEGGGGKDQKLIHSLPLHIGSLYTLYTGSPST